MTERDRNFRRDWQAGPTGPAPTTEATGDPEADDVAAGGEGGAATGAILGTAVAGPVGLVAGAVIGEALGAAGEAADADADRGYERNATGTGPTDPIYAADRAASRGGRDTQRTERTDDGADDA